MALTTDKLGSPVKITGTTDTSTEIFGPYPKVFVKWVYWYNVTAAGNLCSIIDHNGRDLIVMRGRRANDVQCWPIMQLCEGVYVDDLDSGTLYIYVR